MKTGVQLRPWLQTLGEKFSSELPKVMQAASKIGFAGFETALPVVLSVDAATFNEWRRAAGNIELAAAHSGGSWWERPDLESLTNQISRLPELGCNRLMVSVSPAVADDETFARATGEVLADLATRAAAYEVEVALHNHAHEITNQQRILNQIFEAAAGSPLKLGADLGWVQHGGVDPSVFIRQHADKISYLHVRDYSADSGFIEIGQGTLDWTAIASALSEIHYTGWLVAESEFTDLWRGNPDPHTTATLQFDGLQRTLI